MSLDNYRKEDGTAISKLKEYNSHLKEKQKRKEAEQQQEAQEIESQMVEDVLMDLSN